METSASTSAPSHEPVPELQAGYRLAAWGTDPTWEEFPVPRPAADEVLVRVDACGVGLTVVNALNGELGQPDSLPVTPGHELVGRVLEIGGAVPRSTGESLLGRRVAAYFYLSCGACRFCVAARENLCERFAGFIGVHRDGGYGRYVTMPALNAIPIPEALDPAAATVIPDAVATPVHVCGSVLHLTPDSRVAVIGAGGGVGMHMVQIAALHGAQVVGLDVEQRKLEALDELMIRPVESRRFEQLDATKLWKAGSPTVVIDLVGSPASLEWSIAALAPGGTLVLLTPFRDRQVVIDPRDAVLREISVKGSRYASRTEVRLAAELVAAGRVRPIVGAECGPASVLELHGRLRRGELLGRGAMRWDD
jgi:D-arabinose 1-dehydrogenase-like Zn-dependent alcohol dehydrogenase